MRGKPFQESLMKYSCAHLMWMQMFWKRINPWEESPNWPKESPFITNSGDLPLITSDYTKENPDRLGHQGSSRPILTDVKINQVNCTPIVEGILEHSYYLIGHTNKDIKENIDGLANNDPSRKRKMENILGNSFILN